LAPLIKRSAWEALEAADLRQISWGEHHRDLGGKFYRDIPWGYVATSENWWFLARKPALL